MALSRKDSTRLSESLTAKGLTHKESAGAAGAWGAGAMPPRFIPPRTHKRGKLNLVIDTKFSRVASWYSGLKSQQGQAPWRRPCPVLWRGARTAKFESAPAT